MEIQTNVNTGELKISSPETQTAATTTTTEVKKEPDLITRVSQHKPEEIKSEVKPEEIKTGEVKIAEPEFDFKDIEKIQDPVAKEYALKAYKSFQKGFNQKFQDIAELRKGLENEKNQLSNWTPERVQGLLKDNQFLEAAKQVAATSAPSTFEGTQEEWSGMSESDKVKFQQMEQKINLLEQRNFQTLKAQEDEQLQTKYANYNPKALDILTADLIQGKVQATREHLWKVVDYDEAIQRAYDLGRQDSQRNLAEKKISSTVDGIQVTNSGEKPTPQKGENSRAFWNRIVETNLAKSRESIKK